MSYPRPEDGCVPLSMMSIRKKARRWLDCVDMQSHGTTIPDRLLAQLIGEAQDDLFITIVDALDVNCMLAKYRKDQQ